MSLNCPPVTAPMLGNCGCRQIVVTNAIVKTLLIFRPMCAYRFVDATGIVHAYRTLRTIETTRSVIDNTVLDFLDRSSTFAARPFISAPGGGLQFLCSDGQIVVDNVHDPSPFPNGGLNRIINFNVPRTCTYSNQTSAGYTLNYTSTLYNGDIVISFADEILPDVLAQEMANQIAAFDMNSIPWPTGAQQQQRGTFWIQNNETLIEDVEAELTRFNLSAGFDCLNGIVPAFTPLFAAGAPIPLAGYSPPFSLLAPSQTNCGPLYNVGDNIFAVSSLRAAKSIIRYDGSACVYRQSMGNTSRSIPGQWPCSGVTCQGYPASGSSGREIILDPVEAGTCVPHAQFFKDNCNC